MNSRFQKLAEVPSQEYHVHRDANGTKYILATNMYYIDQFMESRSYFAGETALSYLHFELLSLLVTPSHYRLVLDDCLEFAKRFVREIAINENGVREKKVDELFSTILVSEQYFIVSIEESSRQNRASALSAALSYFSSFRLERAFFLSFIIFIIFYLLRSYTRAQLSHQQGITSLILC